MTGLFFNLIISTVAVIVLVPCAFGDPLEKCQARNVTYKIGDHLQCDKYYECLNSGKIIERLCDDGFVYSLQYSHCNYPHVVECADRKILQKSPSTNPQCPRMNGFYAFPAEVSCQKFHHCLEGTAYEKTCPEGIIFDDTKGACVHPDLVGRAECSASAVLNFRCPNSDKRFSKLRFGNHDRLPHPSDCRKFFICTQDGQPRIGGCPVGKVFNPKTGTCIQAKLVEGCKDYYGKKSGHAKLVGDDDDEDLTNEQEAVSNNESESPANEKAKDASLKGSNERPTSKVNQ